MGFFFPRTTYFCLSVQEGRKIFMSGALSLRSSVRKKNLPSPSKGAAEGKTDEEGSTPLEWVSCRDSAPAAARHPFFDV